MFFDAAKYCPKLRCTGYIKLHFSVYSSDTVLYEKNSFGALCTAICKRENHSIVKRKNSARSTRQGLKPLHVFLRHLTYHIVCASYLFTSLIWRDVSTRGSRSFTNKTGEISTVRKFLVATEAANRSALNKFRGFIHHGPSGWISHSLWDERDLIKFELCWIRIG